MKKLRFTIIEDDWVDGIGWLFEQIDGKLQMPLTDAISTSSPLGQEILRLSASLNLDTLFDFNVPSGVGVVIHSPHLFL